jgi:hypothetical protein
MPAKLNSDLDFYDGGPGLDPAFEFSHGKPGDH